MTTANAPTPTDHAFPGLTPDDLCVSIDEGILGEIQIGDRPRATAISAFASEAGLAFTDVRCTVGHLRFLTREDVWESHGRDRFYDDTYNQFIADHQRRPEADEIPEAPEEPPGSWRPEDHYPAWEWCKADHPEAIRVWHCEEKSTR